MEATVGLSPKTLALLMDYKKYFPCSSPTWYPPPAGDHWWEVQSARVEEAFCFNDVLVAVALALCRQGPSQSTTFYVTLKELVQVAFPSHDIPLVEWRPVLGTTSDARAFIALELNNVMSLHELIDRAKLFRVPIFVSLDGSRSRIRIVYDKFSVGRTQAEWFLIHIKNALCNLQHGSSPILRAAETFLLSHNVSRLLPSSMFIRVANILWSLRNHGVRLSTDVLLMNDAEQALMGDIATLPFRYGSWSSHPHASIVHGHFLECARATPLSIAFQLHPQRRGGDSSPVIDISYSSAHTIAARLAAELRTSGVCSGSVVPLLLSNPMEISICMIAVMLAGAAYAIIDPKELDLIELQECMGLSRVRSSTVLVNQHELDSIKLLHLESIDPRDVIDASLCESIHSQGYTPVSDLPTVVEQDLAFISRSAASTSLWLSFTHRDASELLRTCINSHKIGSTSKILFMNDCPSWLLHGIAWNIFALGGRICSVAGEYDAKLAEILHDLQFLMKQGWVHGPLSRFLQTLIVSDDLSPELRHQWEDSPFAGTVEIIKYGDVTPLETITAPAIVDDAEIHVVYHADDGVDITPEQVLELLPSGVILYEATGRKVIQITETLVVKCGAWATEVHNLNFVRAHTDIPVPRPYLFFHKGLGYYAVMEYIPGDTLEMRWDSLEESMRMSVVEQLGGYLRQLRTLENFSSVPGPVDRTPCCGRWFGLFDAGPFETYDDLIAWLNRKRDASRNTTHEPFTTEGYKLVFTHQDLAPRNMILDKSNRLWVLDWELAGWYPSYFEYACVRSSVLPIPKDLLKGLLPYLGPYEREYRSLNSIFWVLMSYSRD
ncbi:hypothetical protein Hypma_014698 [Hypsizygus marmoreus]|uniref:Aminoglycoside phosphotransferase domain-containing protein n=1 Tax=Hypsizygus marmoreus TaxID=39966 RepID=A0A369JG33_HYPMA|nr:hypothetical protein Hypma_014698 [Hypsizygus marmoreus]